MKLYSFECDECGVSEDVLPRRDVNAENPLRQARKELPQGWTLRNGKDLCPQCAPRL